MRLEHPSRQTIPARYDCIVLGAGYVGSLCALTLRRKGYSVALLERGAQPRFSIGESSTAEQNRVHAILARELRVPELAPLCSYPKLKKPGLAIPAWPKEAFYFLLAGDASGGREPREILMQSIPWPVGPDYHCARADYDLYLLTLAVKYGADYFGMSELRDLDLEGGVSCGIETAGGAVELRGRLLVDASGPSSVLARTLGIGECASPETTLRSRAIYSHFVDVRRIEERYRDWPRLGIPRDHSTVHLPWDGGWAWVIPFDNGVTSVGVVLDMSRDRLDHETLEPSEAFWATVRQNVHLSALLDGARSIRPYVRTGQIQRRARQVVGDGWVMLPPAGGLADPLLSPGNAVAANGVGRLAWAADAMLRDGRPAPEALAFMERRFFLEFEYIRKVQHVLFESFRDPDLFREAFVLFPMAVKLGAVTQPEPDPARAFQTLWGFGNPAFRELTDAVHGVVTAGRRAGEDPAALAMGVRETIRRHDATRFARHFTGEATTTHVHQNRVLPLLRWARSLRSSPDARIAEASRGAVGRILAHAWTARTTPASRPRSLLPLMLRQAWIQATGDLGRRLLSGRHRRLSTDGAPSPADPELRPPGRGRELQAAATRPLRDTSTLGSLD